MSGDGQQSAPPAGFYETTMDMNVGVWKDYWPQNISAIIAVDDSLLVRYSRSHHRLDMIEFDCHGYTSAKIAEQVIPHNKADPSGHIHSIHHFVAGSDQASYILCLLEDNRRYLVYKLAKGGFQAANNGTFHQQYHNFVQFKYRDQFFGLTYNSMSGEYCIFSMNGLALYDVASAALSRGRFRHGWTDLVWKGTHHVRCTRQKFFCYNSETGEVAFECVYIKVGSQTSSVCSQEHISIEVDTSRGKGPASPTGGRGGEQEPDSGLTMALKKKNCIVFPLLLGGSVSCLLYYHTDLDHTNRTPVSTGKLPNTRQRGETNISRNVRDNVAHVLHKRVFAHREPWTHFCVFGWTHVGGGLLLSYSSMTGSVWLSSIFPSESPVHEVVVEQPAMPASTQLHVKPPGGKPSSTRHKTLRDQQARSTVATDPADENAVLSPKAIEHIDQAGQVPVESRVDEYTRGVETPATPEGALILPPSAQSRPSTARTAASSRPGSGRRPASGMLPTRPQSSATRLTRKIRDIDGILKATAPPPQTDSRPPSRGGRSAGRSTPVSRPNSSNQSRPQSRSSKTSSLGPTPEDLEHIVRYIARTDFGDTTEGNNIINRAIELIRSGAVPPLPSAGSRASSSLGSYPESLASGSTRAQSARRPKQKQWYDVRKLKGVPEPVPGSPLDKFRHEYKRQQINVELKTVTQAEVDKNVARIYRLAEAREDKLQAMRDREYKHMQHDMVANGVVMKGNEYRGMLDRLYERSLAHKETRKTQLQRKYVHDPAKHTILPGEDVDAIIQRLGVDNVKQQETKREKLALKSQRELQRIQKPSKKLDHEHVGGMFDRLIYHPLGRKDEKVTSLLNNEYKVGPRVVVKRTTEQMAAYSNALSTNDRSALDGPLFKKPGVKSPTRASPSPAKSPAVESPKNSVEPKNSLEQSPGNVVDVSAT